MFWHSLPRPPESTPARPPKMHPPTALALQGGGAYGAFAWGVLDRLLEEEDFTLAGMSGASAGAINATVTAWGLLEGGREGARAALRQLWTSVGKMSWLNPLGLPGASLQFDLLSRIVSPYQFNPLNFNPLRDLLVSLVDFERLRRDGRIPLFISTTNVNTGEPRIFREHEVSVDVLMASSCIPYVYQAVDIDGQSYWDGGFSANPPILPLVLETACRSLVLVKLTPESEPDLPTAAPEIFARLKRILFNATLLRELDAIEEMQRLLHRSNLLPYDLRRLRDLPLFRVTIDHGFFAAANGSQAFDPRPEVLDKLYEAGRSEAEERLGEFLGADAASGSAPGRGRAAD